MEELNDYLKKIGCKNTSFNNPHGLHHPEHVTTAHDLGIMAQEALKDPLFRQIVSSVRYTCPQTNLELERHLVQGNQLLRKGAHHYPKAIGVKTGFTQTAGKNLVAAAQEGDRVLIAVALGYKGPRAELYNDVKHMFEAAFQEPKLRRILLPKGEPKLSAPVPGARKRLKTTLADGLSYDFYKSEVTPIKVTVYWEVPPLPIVQGAVVGQIKVIDSYGTTLNQVPLLALEELTPTLWHRLKCFLREHNRGRKIVFVGVSCVLLFIVWRIIRLRKNRPSPHKKGGK